MRLRELWWDWNPRRLRRLLKISKGAVDANANLCSNYFQQMQAAQKRADHADQLANIRGQRIEALEQELEARNGELHTLRKDTQ